VDGGLVRNRSHAIEYALRSGLQIAELTTVFIILGNTFSPQPTLLKRLKSFPIFHLYLVSPSAKLGEAQLVSQACKEELPSAVVEVVPADFGDAAAILLKQAELSPSILLIDLDVMQDIPENFLPGYAFHRQQLATATQMVRATPEGYTPSGIAFAQKSLTADIPAGLASLKETVFPTLVKGGKVRAYVYA
jgi:hypothetical protein